MPAKSVSSIVVVLKSILHSGSAGTQEEIKHALEQQGYAVNQSKISRLLRKLGAIKTTNEQKQIVYTLPLEPAPPTSKNILSQLVLSITTNETLIVIRTNPGSASLIGRLLDHNTQALNILGTVAGDDTVFIAPKSIKQIPKILIAVKSFLAETA
ncbi:arginine repressor [Aquicella lusitana]|uniref:Arginine repressor n=1 Tax=Aquicella lusitana TaxID=254246 RepID=A0A370GJH8_9COXI|nr:arginine repressor [Aquicella lusitana]RDI42554.1 ArgR family transcriptional regulator [Aquicella lusitana]VVC74333.1 Arginine repressor [Aquicella lusitana]